MSTIAKKKFCSFREVLPWSSWVWNQANQPTSKKTVCPQYVQQQNFKEISCFETNGHNSKFSILVENKSFDAFFLQKMCDFRVNMYQYNANLPQDTYPWQIITTLCHNEEKSILINLQWFISLYHVSKFLHEDVKKKRYYFTAVLSLHQKTWIKQVQIFMDF